ncbi:hypothetical protein GBAR_LOCUS367 [Geodia barretti]|uniref:Uncharacterized protein n=1 Tax=Geodia barretti TaxID=519541 RepID=A0AA35QSQ6_GEOBA|nr:hypothetical protein GBAR_LOCUS367 [Geodia barretti]
MACQSVIISSDTMVVINPNTVRFGCPPGALSMEES